MGSSGYSGCCSETYLATHPETAAHTAIKTAQRMGTSVVTGVNRRLQTIILSRHAKAIGWGHFNARCGRYAIIAPGWLPTTRNGASTSTLASVTYKSKKDTWLVILIYGTVCACLAVYVLPLLTSPRLTLAALLVAAPLIAMGVLFPIWILQTTYYLLSDEQLLVRCGPFRWSIPLEEIQTVRRSRSMLSGPAMSLDRVEIRYSRYGSVLISPERREQFLVDLENRRRRLAREARST